MRRGREHLTQTPAHLPDMDYLLILVALAFISTSQILQKVAAVNADKQATGTHFLRRLAARKETWWAIMTLGTGTLF